MIKLYNGRPFIKIRYVDVSKNTSTSKKVKLR